MKRNVPTVVITGPVGVGKSSVASAVSNLLAEANLPYAMVDMDHMRWCNLTSAKDPFNERIGYRNLSLVWPTYAEEGAERLIIVDVVEERDYKERYRQSVPGAEVVIVRLRASVQTILKRLAGRESGSSLDRLQTRAVELVVQMDRGQVEDIVIDTEGKTVLDIAAEVLERVSWK